MTHTVLTIRSITASQWIDKAWTLLQAHRRELATNPDIMDLKPRRERYEALEALGAMVSLGLFDGDSLIGYSVNIIDANMHYADLVVGQNDLLFVHPKYRKSQDGLALIHATEDALRARGARMMVWHAKEGTALQGMMPRLGYRVQDVIFSKVL